MRRQTICAGAMLFGLLFSAVWIGSDLIEEVGVLWFLHNKPYYWAAPLSALIITTGVGIIYTLFILWIFGFFPRPRKGKGGNKK